MDNSDNNGDDEARNKGGRPSKLTPERRSLLLDCVREGLSIESASRIAGISSRAVRRHQQKDKGFVRSLKKAVAESERSLVGRIRSADDWRAAAYLLAKRHSRHWGRWKDDERPKPRRVHPAGNGMMELPPNATPAMIAAHDRMIAALNEFQLEQSRAESGYGSPQSP